MREVRVEKKIIGEGNPAFIIAEIGSNYNQDFNIAKKMINIVKESGADAVKFQIFKDEKLYARNAGKADYLENEIGINDIVKKAEVPDEMHKKLFDYCKEAGILYLCTPTDEDVADYLDDLGVKAFKIASYDLTNHFLLKHVAKKGKPVILSTGAGYFSEVGEAVNVIRGAGNDNIVLMQCVAQYPAAYECTNLKIMEVYEKAFNLPAGISDHSLDPFIVPYAAAAMGAKIVEKHFTLGRNQEGPDHSFAIEPDELIRMVDGIRKIEIAEGTGEKEVAKGEEELRKFAFRSIFSTKEIKVGECIDGSNSYVLRPGKKEPGIDAKYFEFILGSKAVKNIEANQAIKWEDVIAR